MELAMRRGPPSQWETSAQVRIHCPFVVCAACLGAAFCTHRLILWQHQTTVVKQSTVARGSLHRAPVHAEARYSDVGS